jgi:hypothetical protein
MNGRELALLRAVAAGRAELTVSSEPDLTIDGLNCCDQTTAHSLSHAGLICPGRVATLGTRVPAALTSAGIALLGGAA